MFTEGGISRLRQGFYVLTAITLLSTAGVCVFLGLKHLKPSTISSSKQVTRTQAWLTHDTGHQINEFTTPSMADVPLAKNIWLPVDNETDLYMFSAYYDDIEHPTIRVLGSGRRPNSSNVTCFLQWTKEADSVEMIQGWIEKHSWDWQPHVLIAVSALCPLSSTALPYAVSIVRNKNDKPRHRILIQPPNKKRVNFTVCLPPFYNNYRKVDELLQCFEMAQILGAEKIRIYNFSIHPKVSRVLEIYQKAGVVDVIPWDISTRIDLGRNMTLAFFAQDVAMDDCLYANLHSSKFLIFQDKDEVLLPHKHKTWGDLMSNLSRQHPTAGSFLMLNSFFSTSYQDSNDGYRLWTEAKRLGLHFLLKVWRERKIWRPRYRSKAIIIPERVHSLGVHHVMYFRKGYKEASIDPGIGLLHHYRYWGANKDKVTDESIRRFSEDLVGRVTAMRNILGNKTL